MNKDLSVVIPAKNEEMYVGRCLDALIASAAAWKGEVEIILVDNNSVDSTKRIALSKGCKVIDVPEGNIGSLRNRGAEEAKGRVIAFLDADCVVLPGWILYCMQALEDDRIGCVGTRAIPDFDHATWVEKCWHTLMTGAERPKYVEWLGTSNLLVPRDLFLKIGGFDERIETGEDVNLCYRIRESHKIRLEERVCTLHLRESKTLTELFKRELWRGKSSLHSFIQNEFPKKEIPSVFGPLINLLMYFLLIVLTFGMSRIVILPFVMLLLFPAALMLKKKVEIRPSYDVLACYTVALVFITARTFSIGGELIGLMERSMGKVFAGRGVR